MEQTVLYIEDNLDNVEIVTHILEKEGYTVLVATEGISGILLADEHKPDAIICDLHLPGISGIIVIDQIRKMPELAHTPIIMLTADIYARPQSFDAGADAYINKPIRRNMLLRRLDEVLKARV